MRTVFSLLKRGGIACLFSLFIFVPLRAQVEERVFSLDDAIITGLHNSQEYLVLQEQTSLAQQRINEAKSLIYPKIDFNLNASRFNNDLPTVLAPSFNSLYLPQGTKYLYYTTRFSLWQYLYAGGRYTTTVRLAEINLSQAQSQADVARNKVVLDVKKSFFSCIAAREKINAYAKAQADVAALKGKNAAARNRWAVLDNTLQDGILVAEHEYEKCQLSFLNTVGTELNSMIGFQEDGVPVLEEYDLNKCLARAYQYRPELRQTQFEETIDSLRVNLSLTERYPTITLGANYEWVGDDFPLNDKNWNATLNFNVPIFDGWASWARIKQQRNQAREGKIRRAKIEDQIRYEVRSAYLDYQFWKQRFAALESPQPAEQDPERKLDATLVAIEIRQNAAVSKATLEWAMGNSYK